MIITNKEVVLLATHFVDDSVINKYRRLNSELDTKKYVVILLVNMEEGKSFEFPLMMLYAILQIATP